MHTVIRISGQESHSYEWCRCGHQVSSNDTVEVKLPSVDNNQCYTCPRCRESDSYSIEE